MESTRLGSRLSRSLLFEVTFFIAISTWYSAVCQEVTVNQNCSGSDSCTDPNATCRTTCQCKSNFYYNSNVCTAKAALGKNCNRNGTCLDPLALCASTCQCPSDYYNSNGTCVQRHPPGAVCTNTIQCVQYANCSSSGVSGEGTCTCWDTHYSDSSKGVCKQSLGYGSTCTVGTNNMCTVGLTCRQNTNGSDSCLCNDKTFRYNNACQSVDMLKLLNVSRNSEEETNLNLTLIAPSLGQNLKYKVSLNNADSNVTSVTYFRFQNRTPGTLYTANVITSVLRDPGYSTEEEVSPAITKVFFTKPAKPGNLSLNVYPGPNVTIQFHKSEGGVDFYIVTITLTGKTPTANVTPQSNDLIDVNFYNLTPGDYYNVTIVARSGGISSDVAIGQFRVDADLSGPVRDLSVAEKSRQVDVEWGFPLMPNEDMMGYTVEVTPVNISACVSGVAVVCSDCLFINVTMRDTSLCTHSASKTQTRDQLQSTTIRQMANVTGLSPYVRYVVTVIPFNERGAGQMSTLSFQTKSEAAPNLLSLEAVTSQTQFGQLNVRWVPGDKTGDTSYTIS